MNESVRSRDVTVRDGSEEVKMEKKKSSILMRFILRAFFGLIVILGTNQFLDYRNIPVSVGINLISFLTSGDLGIPGVCLLYGIMFYQIM